jgi:hypothetical protein
VKVLKVLKDIYLEMKKKIVKEKKIKVKERFEERAHKVLLTF